MNDQPADCNAAVPAWVRKLGITDRVTGLERAHASWDMLCAAGVQGLSGLHPGAEYTTGHMVFSGFLARRKGSTRERLPRSEPATRTDLSLCSAPMLRPLPRSST